MKEKVKKKLGIIVLWYSIGAVCLTGIHYAWYFIREEIRVHQCIKEARQKRISEDIISDYCQIPPPSLGP